MPGALTIRVQTEWTDTEADGEPCAHCGDRIFLRQHTFMVRLITSLEKTRPSPAAHLCDSCYSALIPSHPFHS